MISLPILDKTMKTVLISSSVFPLWLEHEVNQHFRTSKIFICFWYLLIKMMGVCWGEWKSWAIFCCLGKGMNFQGLQQELAPAFPALWFILFLGFIVNCCTGLE